MKTFHKFGSLFYRVCLPLPLILVLAVIFNGFYQLYSRRIGLVDETKQTLLIPSSHVPLTNFTMDPRSKSR